jgi:hypothetical protein
MKIVVVMLEAAEGKRNISQWGASIIHQPLLQILRRHSEEGARLTPPE